MSVSLLQVGLLVAGVICLVGGAALAIYAARLANSGRAAKAEADIRLTASRELAAEVKRLAEKVEQSLEARDAAIENAFLRHNDACAASVHSAFGDRDGDRHDAAGDNQPMQAPEPSEDEGGRSYAIHHPSESGDLFKEEQRSAAQQSPTAKRPSLLARLLGRAA